MNFIWEFIHLHINLSEEEVKTYSSIALLQCLLPGNIHLYLTLRSWKVTTGRIPNGQQTPLLTWNGLVVHQIKHDDKNARPCNDESQNQDPGQWGAESRVEVICKTFLGHSHRRRPGVSVLAVDDHGGGGRWSCWGAKTLWSDTVHEIWPSLEPLSFLNP